MFLQQGDVLIKSAKKVSGKKMVVKNGRFVIAEGEVTRHNHAIAECPGVTCFEDNGIMFMENKEPVTITHEEHGAVEIPAGIWEFGRVQEYDHFAEEARAVRD